MLIEIVSKARQSLFLAAPFIYVSPNLAAGSLVPALYHAARRGVAIDIVSTAESLERLRSSMPEFAAQRTVRLFRPTAGLSATALGSHAKVFIADERYAYMGSANLTDPGLKTNLEMGVLIEGTLARQAADFWKELIGLGFLHHMRK